MKRIIMPALAALALCITNPAMGADAAKVATLDLRKIALESKAGEEATKTLSKMAEKVNANLKAKQAELEKIRDALEGKGKKLSAKERTAKEKEIQKKLDQYRELSDNARKELQGKEDELGNKIMKDIDKVVKEYAVKNGYTLIIRKADLVYKDGKQELTDVTDDILKLVDALPPAGKK